MQIEDTHWTIRTIVGRYGVIMNNAELQRDQAWKGETGIEKRHGLIDSVFHNFPIPSCLVGKKVVEGHEVYELFDGGHLMETVTMFHKGKITFKGKRFDDLTAEDQERFLERRVPVTEITNGDAGSLALVFVRLNSGVALKASDFCWAYRSKPLIAEAIRLVVGNQKLAHALGGYNMEHRPMLANWVGLTLALSKSNAGMMTSSWTRVAPHIEEDVDVQSVADGIAAYTNLLERANLSHPVESTVAAKYAKAGFLAAYWLSEWIEAVDSDAKGMVQDKWYSIICNLRSRKSETREAMLDALTISGAQNLNDTKVKAVLVKVAEHVKSDVFEVPATAAWMQAGFLEWAHSLGGTQSLIAAAQAQAHAEGAPAHLITQSQSTENQEHWHDAIDREHLINCVQAEIINGTGGMHVIAQLDELSATPGD